jgi:hypothetical protein
MSDVRFQSNTRKAHTIFFGTLEFLIDCKTVYKSGTNKIFNYNTTSSQRLSNIFVIPSEKYSTIFDYELYSTDYSMNQIND